MEKIEDKDLIFGLDIGTRTVIGVVGYYEEKNFYIDKVVCKEHQDRAMLDGQIHDIEKVADIVGQVKAELESFIGYPLKEVAIAAAGRVLNTQTADAEYTFDEVQPISPIHIQTLQVEGINIAQKMLEQERGLKDSDYFCVGHTVMQYALDGYPISNLEGHKGRSIGAKVLATFLPKEVVNSLYTVMERVGLEVSQLTLEPIAAINAVIPENLRLLNLALVDVGAGTSDLAITKEGSVVAYGMIPLAGDEVTEAILHHYLVDFATAEKIKQQIQTKQVIKFTDIIGIQNETTPEEVEQVIEPIINQLAEDIADKIKSLNGGRSPNAVFCVGGGSQMSGLLSKVSEHLGLPEQRVSLRKCDHISEITYKKGTTKGPEMITPIGICLTTAKYFNKQFTHIRFNEEDLYLLNTKKLTVLDALIEKGIKHDGIFPMRGETLMYKINGERIRLKGTVGTAALIQLNGRDVGIDTFINSGDNLTFIPAQKGSRPQIIFEECIQGASAREIYVNGEPITLPLLLANGDYVTEKYEVQNQDVLEILDIETMQQLLEQFSFIDQECDPKVNGETVGMNYILQHGDSITTENRKKKDEEVYKKEESKAIEETDKCMTITVNEKIITLPEREEPYLFVHVFDYIDFDLTKPQGTIQLTLNGQRAAVIDALSSGDKLEIYWEK